MRPRPLHLFFAFLLVSSFAYAQLAEDWYVDKPIKDITFEGLRNVKQSELEGVVQPFIGRLFDDSLFADLQAKIYALDYFEVIAPSAIPSDATGSSIILNFKVTEKPFVSSVAFQGNKAIRNAELLDTVNVKIGDVVNALKLRMDEQAIQDLYLERGYPSVKVRSETSQKDEHSMAITFVIDEGEQVSIESIRFTGNVSVSEKTLRGLLSLKPKSLLNQGAFQESKLSADKAAVEAYYHERGYVDATVRDVSRNLRVDDKGRNFLSLVFDIFEGKQYLFGGISFEGNKIFSTERLASLVVQQKGQVLNYKRLEADFQRVADLYYENGYIFNTITRSEKRDEGTLTISYAITIVERDRAHIESITVKGNTKTKDYVILREVPMEVGDIFSKTKLYEGLRALYNLQYFSSVTPKMTEGSADNLMDLTINVEEQSTADVQFGLTFSGLTSPDSFPISGLIKLSDSNFRGTGQTLGLELNGSPDLQKAAVNYTERWLFGKPLSGTFEFAFTHSQVETKQDTTGPVFDNDEEGAFPDPYTSWDEYVNASYTVPSAYLMTYEQWKWALSFSTGYRFLTPLGQLSVGGGVSSGLVKNTYDETVNRPFDPTLRAYNNQWTLTQSIYSSVGLDNRDLSYDPSKGYYASQRMSITGLLPLEKEHYIRTDTKAEAFFTAFDWPIFDNWSFKGVFGFHSGLSLILPEFVGDPVIESSNKLNIDGMFIARGWYDERQTYGRALWENWAEFRTPLVPGVLAMDWFLDAAALKKTPELLFSDLSLDDFFFSLGAGLRFTIPQFPFRFSLAKRFKIVDGAIEWQQGDLWQDSSRSDSGLDFVISFVLSSY